MITLSRGRTLIGACPCTYLHVVLNNKDTYHCSVQVDSLSPSPRGALIGVTER